MLKRKKSEKGLSELVVFMFVWFPILFTLFIVIDLAHVMVVRQGAVHAVEQTARIVAVVGGTEGAGVPSNVRPQLRGTGSCSRFRANFATCNVEYLLNNSSAFQFGVLNTVSCTPARTASRTSNATCSATFRIVSFSGLFTNTNHTVSSSVRTEVQVR